jgi:hypothetical protein
MLRIRFDIQTTIALSTLMLIVVAGPAAAMSCRDWDRLGPDRRAMAVEGMIQDTIAGSRGRQYNVSREAIERCLYGYARDIEYSFDDACGSSRTSGMGALRSIFKGYIWSCVN